jgi:hypothetical protein
MSDDQTEEEHMTDIQPTVADMRRIIIELESVNLRFDIEQMRLDRSSDLVEQHEAKLKMAVLVQRRVALLEEAGVADIVCRGEAR